nr:GNAT family N-acetyltransferase [uncultured Cohaesibacter sp.]
MTAQLRLAKAEQIAHIRPLIFSAFSPIAERMNQPIPEDAWSDLGDYAEQRNLYILKEEDSDTIVGMICFSEGNDHLYVDTLAIHPDHQGRRLGKMLLQDAEMIAESRGHPYLRLHTPEVMEDLLRFYTHLGFRETKRALPSHGRDTILRVHFEKEIAHSELRVDPEFEHDRQPA